MSEWLAVEAIVRQREEEKTARALAKIAREQKSAGSSDVSGKRESLEVEIGNISDISDLSVDTEEEERTEERHPASNFDKFSNKLVNSVMNQDAGLVENKNLLNLQWEKHQSNCEPSVIHLLSVKSSPSTSSYETVANEFPADIEGGLFTPCQEQIASNPMELAAKSLKLNAERDYQLTCYCSVEDIHSKEELRRENELRDSEEEVKKTIAITFKTVENSPGNSLISSLNEDSTVIASLDTLQDQVSTCPSPVSSNGGIYSVNSSKDS